jgi:long-chain acyl-CoA synthetase
MKTFVDYASLNSLPEIWTLAAKQFGEIVALHDPHAKPETILTYAQLLEQLRQFAAGLQACGVKPDDKVALFADNSARWFVADQGIIMAGAANVVRSSVADREELLYILSDSDSTSLIVEDLKTIEKLRPQLDNLPIEFIVLLSDEKPDRNETLKVLNFSQLLELGANHSFNPVRQERKSLATLIYTSGTTGKPKGVMLSHANLLHQVTTLSSAIPLDAGDRVLSILPSWHSYERSCEYFLLSRGCTQIYTNIRTFKNDLKRFKPHVMVGVPRLWDSLYEAIQKQFREQSPTRQRLVNFFLNLSKAYIEAQRIAQNLSLENLHPTQSQQLIAKIKAILLKPLHALGDRLVYKKIRAATGSNIKYLISGGGSLAKHLDDFYEIVGVPLLVGYGLTETSPVTNARTYKRNLRGSAGQPLPQTEIRIVDPETRQTLSSEQKGLVLIRGPQVMQGYYKKTDATVKAIDAEGWFDSGDLGWVTRANDLVLTGREKDTIVLNNGENIEPQPIEDACLRSPYIDQIVLVGQDQRSLGALIVPNLDVLEKWAQAQKLNLTFPDPKASRSEIESSILYSQPVRDLFRQELNREVKNRPGYRADDQIKVFSLILEPFSLDNGMMTQTLKVKRPVVSERYRDMIDGMFDK